MHHIATITQSPGLKTFTNIPQIYTHLQLRMVHRDIYATTPSYSYMRFNGDLGNTANNHWLRGNGASVQSAANQINLNYVITAPQPASNALADIYASTIIDILDYTNTAKFKTARALSGYDLNGSGFVGLYSGVWRNTAAITSIGIGSAYQEDATYFKVSLYGLTSSSTPTVV
jgi:hypothetical protein